MTSRKAAALPTDRTWRTWEATGAGAESAMWRALAFASLVLLALPFGRYAMGWYVRGVPETDFPGAPPALQESLRVDRATVDEADAVRAAVAGLRYRVDPRTVMVVLADEGSMRGRSEAGDYRAGVITIRRAIVDVGGPALSSTLAHELGHLVDERFVTDRTRDAFRTMRRIPARLSWTAPAFVWQRRPAEDFAACFAARAQHYPSRYTNTAYGEIQDRRAFEHILAMDGVPLDNYAPEQDRTAALVRDLALYARLLVDPLVGIPAALAAFAFVTYGFVTRSEREWWRCVQ